jgi:hypothetical protein
MEMNGGSVIAMTGKNCVAIASDLRLGQQAVGLSADFEKVRFVFSFLVSQFSFLGLPSGSSSKIEMWIEIKIKIKIKTEISDRTRAPISIPHINIPYPHLYLSSNLVALGRIDETSRETRRVGSGFHLLAARTDRGNLPARVTDARNLR